MPYVHRPYHSRYDAHGRMLSPAPPIDLLEVTKSIVTSTVNAPKRFLHYLRDGIGDEHAAEEEAKRQAILKQQKRG